MIRVDVELPCRNFRSCGQRIPLAEHAMDDVCHLCRMETEVEWTRPKNLVLIRKMKSSDGMDVEILKEE